MISPHERNRRFMASLLTGLLVPALCVVMLAPPAAVGADEASAEKHTLVIGKVSDNPKKHYKYLKPIVDYAVQRMGDLGITEGKVLMARDNRQMIRYLRRGKVDWVTETAFSAVLYEEKAGAEILVRKWKKGVPEYYTVFFTRNDSGIESLADLRGRVIAFEDPGSTTAFFVPASVLLGEGYELAQLESPREKPPADMVGYVFAGDEINISTWVHKGLVDAGAYNNLDWKTEDHTPSLFRKNMTIFHQTRSFPRAVELVRKDLDPAVKSRLKTILLKAHDDPKGRSALKAYQKTTQFDELDTGTKAGLEEARRITATFHSKLE